MPSANRMTTPVAVPAHVPRVVAGTRLVELSPAAEPARTAAVVEANVSAVTSS